MLKRVVINCELDEDFNLVGSDYKDCTVLDLDLSKIKKINSIGMRYFIEFLNSIPASTSINYYNCSPLFVHMLNILDGLLPKNVTVKSLFAPYFCPTCQKEYLVEMQAPFNVNALNSNKTCSDDSSPLEFFYVEKTFFKFLKT